jgi:hypothetical protein
MKLIVLAALAVLVCAMPAAASNCWYTPMGVVCTPGWSWRDGHEWNERERYRDRRPDEDSWRRHRHEEERHHYEER